MQMLTSPCSSSADKDSFTAMQNMCIHGIKREIDIRNNLVH